MTEITYDANVEFNIEDRRNELIEMLRNNKCEVTFTKVSGEVRVMPCTLKEGVVPPPPPKPELGLIDPEKVKKSNLDVLSTWCLDRNEWRSFRVANVTNIKVIE